MDGGDFGERHRRGRRPGRAGPRPCVALERAGKVVPGRAIACASRAPHQVWPNLSFFPFPSASDSGDGGSCNAGSPADALAASSRSGSTSGGAPDVPSSPAAAEAEAASDQRLPRDSYLPCFRPFPNSTRIEDSLISRSASVDARPVFPVRSNPDCRARPARQSGAPSPSAPACSRRPGAWAPPPAFRALPLWALPAFLPRRGYPAMPSSRRTGRGRRPPPRFPRSAPRVFA